MVVYMPENILEGCTKLLLGSRMDVLRMRQTHFCLRYLQFLLCSLIFMETKNLSTEETLFILCKKLKCPHDNIALD